MAPLLLALQQCPKAVSNVLIPSPSRWLTLRSACLVLLRRYLPEIEAFRSNPARLPDKAQMLERLVVDLHIGAARS